MIYFFTTIDSAISLNMVSALLKAYIIFWVLNNAIKSRSPITSWISLWATLCCGNKRYRHVTRQKMPSFEVSKHQMRIFDQWLPMVTKSSHCSAVNYSMISCPRRCHNFAWNYRIIFADSWHRLNAAQGYDGSLWRHYHRWHVGSTNTTHIGYTAKDITKIK